MQGLSAGSHSYNWDAGGLEDGSSYYLYLVVRDGDAVSQVYAPVPVVIGDQALIEPTPRSGVPPMDYDGDGASDHCVYRALSGVFFQNR